ncbi:ABC transporter permease [Paenibacillus methanolicus]|uniref:Putative aldouronate transport system permease protein n=1 Tax=Paenibacillus methanolicus TaxID=582686 RepID=A0A5S5C264_9BACL|nr:ABC transporter permease subunit [Paenibacillus methanolicus]TYP73249.1 putative aldouronate transport system permease protein [Paenibacillus methanolicus]
MRERTGFALFVHSLWKYRFLTIMLAPALAVLVVNNYMPMFGVFIAFKNINYIDGIFGSPWVGFKNFEFLFNSGSIWRITRNTVLYSVAFMIVNTVLSVVIAVAINELRGRLAKTYQTFLIMPYFLSMIVVGYLVYAFLNPEKGFVNGTVLEWFGADPVSWYSEKPYWPYILILVNAWKNVGIGAVIYIAAIAGIDNEYYEAAVIDGATKWKQIVHITLPLIQPIIVILTILSMGSVFNTDFGLFYQVPMDSGALYPVTDTVDTYVYRVLMELNDIGMSSAAALAQSVLGFILVLLTNSAVRRINSDQALF